MPLEGYPAATRSATPVAQRLTDLVDLRARWGERIAAAVATGVAVLIVAAIAVLMGMA